MPPKNKQPKTIKVETTAEDELKPTLTTKSTVKEQQQTKVKQDTTKNNTPFKTTSSGLIVYNFDSDAESDGEDVPAPLPLDQIEDELAPIQAAKNAKAKSDDLAARFYTELSKNPMLDDAGVDGQLAAMDELNANNRNAMIQRKINTHADLIRKKALAANNKLNVVNTNNITTNQAGDKLKEYIKKCTKDYFKKEYEMADSDLDSQASDYDADALPHIDEDEKRKIQDKANKMLQQYKQEESKKKAAAPKDTMDDNEDIDITPEEAEKYRRAAEALESSDDEDNNNNYRFGESDAEAEEDEEQQDSLDEKLNKDIFETQTNAFTTDEKGDVVKVNHNITFPDMFLSKQTIIGLQKNGFGKPTPIQAAAVPLALKGFDIMANAVTGSGKTIAFLLPIIERLTRMPQRSRAIRAIIITPTRELAEQIFKVAVTLTRYNTATDISISCIFGGVQGQSQEHELRQHPDIVVCTPGRMIDHLTNTMGVSIDRCEVLVLDEADRLLDMGFRDEVGHIIDLTPNYRQTLLFSATVNADVEELIKKSLRGYRRVFVDKASSIVQTLTQQFIRIRHDNDVLRQAIVLSLCKREFQTKCIIFTKTKQYAQELNVLFKLTGLNSGELHGNLTQAQRSEVLEQFRKGEVDFLIATDIASRGLDIKGVLTVINMHLPINYNSYVHRVGRTARAGEKGTAISLVADADRKLLREMMKVHDVTDEDDPFSKVKQELGPDGKPSKKKVKKEDKNNLLLNLKKREIAAGVIDKYTSKIQALQPHINELLDDIKAMKDLEEAERDLQRAERLANFTVQDAKEKAKQTQKTWFQTPQQRAELKDKLKQQLLDAQVTERLASDIIAEARELEKDGDKKKKKTKEEQLRGLSRDEKRRKLFQFEQEKMAKDIRRELESTELTDKQRKAKEHELVSILKPEITAGYIKRQTKRDRLEDSAAARALDDDGAGPQAFEQYARQFEELKYQNNARKRKALEAQLTEKSAQVKYRRFTDQDGVHEGNKDKRFKEATTQYDKKLANMEKERIQARKKTTSHNKFKSAAKHKRRK